jgi:hypothetical protein
MSKETGNVKAFEDLVKVAAHGGPQAMDVPETFSLAPISPVSGGWYFGVKCEDCRNISPAFVDATRGSQPKLFEKCARMRIHLRCTHCQCRLIVPGLSLEPLRWP